MANIYYNVSRILDEGELVVTTKNSSNRFYDTCSSVDKKRYNLVGVVVTGDSRLCALDVTNIENLKEFVLEIGQTSFVKPVLGILYKLPREKVKEFETNRDKACLEMNNGELERFLPNFRSKLSGGLISSMSFS